MSCPLNRIVPLLAGTTPMIALMRLDLPAPLAPTRSTVSPSWTSMDTPRSAGDSAVVNFKIFDRQHQAAASSSSLMPI